MSKYFLLLAFLVSPITQSNEILLRWNQPEGIKRLDNSKFKRDFYELANNFIAQPDGFVCGPTTGAIILNTLRVNKFKGQLPKTSVEEKFIRKTYDPRFERYTTRTFLNAKTDKIKSWAVIHGEKKEGKRDAGLQLRQLHGFFKAHQVDSKIRVVDEKANEATLKKEIIENLKTANDYIVVNYSRKRLGQPGGGHISPVGAYHQPSDSFLILDTNINKDRWVWVKWTDLYEAMRTKDTIENRGFLMLKEGKKS